MSSPAEEALAAVRGFEAAMGANRHRALEIDAQRRALEASQLDAKKRLELLERGEGDEIPDSVAAYFRLRTDLRRKTTEHVDTIAALFAEGQKLAAEQFEEGAQLQAMKTKAVAAHLLETSWREVQAAAMTIRTHWFTICEFRDAHTPRQLPIPPHEHDAWRVICALLPTPKDFDALLRPADEADRAEASARVGAVYQALFHR